MITVEKLTKRYGDYRALDQVSFHLDKGEVVGFLGPNGAGKTTTMRILTGFLPATSGGAEVAGFDVLRRSIEVRKRIGYLPENVPLYGELRVREMMGLQAKLHGLSRSEAKLRIPKTLERVGILDRERQCIGRLSRGQRQRVGLAVALLPEPEVLILDEPTSGLDPLQRLEVRKLIKELATEHTVLISSHILPEIEAVCPRVIIIHRGRLAADGQREELVTRLGGASHVRVEARVDDGRDAAADLRAIPGVEQVVEGDPQDGLRSFDLHCDRDLREEVGTLATRHGWGLRELSWRRPSLEECFARIALDLDEAGEA